MPCLILTPGFHDDKSPASLARSTVLSFLLWFLFRLSFEMHLVSALSLFAASAAALAIDEGASSLQGRADPSPQGEDLTTSNAATCVKGLKTLGYYGNWDIYAAKYFVTDIPAERFTHLSYAFSNIKTETGEVVLSDEWADLQYAYPGDNTKAPGTNVYGNVKQLYLLKKKYRNFKTTLSIGGWSYRMNFSPMLASRAKRETFVKSAVKLVEDLGFDGLDVDYEYVKDRNEAVQMADLLRRLREALDDLAKRTAPGYKFILSYASPAGPEHYKQLAFDRMNEWIDYYSFMGLDYMSAGVSKNSGFMGNVFLDKKNPAATEYETQSGIEYYINQGKVPSSKILLQNAIYGRAFNETKGIGRPYKGAGLEGSLGSAGIWRYRDLPIKESKDLKIVNDKAVIGSYSYNKTAEYLISYDTAEIAKLKAQYTRKMKLAGTSWWEVSQDRTDDLSLVKTTIDEYGGLGALEKSPNNLKYPNSKYDNLRLGFPASS
ncbi:uncharacterized protein UV8b_01489 [Ustilaginoidea virens]|uniref:chitinase n=2 Tax=Ustilaginoidea virens TaxID=1159556 RepID=A0A8E5HL35_USTVR|nr:uncharacterized protein UV8b_01489 [Ustilaginoidea virens]QUC17248.1 hypothetical protein UV8b_01489 [Ustilaginoidea virens]